MPPFSSKPTFVIVPGAAFTPAHYGLLMHLLLEAGYGALSSMLPSIGTNTKVSVEDDTTYVRQRLLLPVLDQEEHDVILVCHSYSSLPGSAAALGLSTTDRLKAGKKTSIIGQIHLASILTPGGDGKNLVDAFGGQTPPHVIMDTNDNLIRCEDPTPPLFHDANPALLAVAASASTICPSMTCFVSPIPLASWTTPGYAGKCAYIKTLDDRAVPVQVQEMMLSGTNMEWMIREINSSHDPQLSHAKDLALIFTELAQGLMGSKAGI